ncbi:MAG: DUF167 domain-containing protein [Candidatus Thermoplasmatota archaeon]|nr:DUF167 domain-containing protein [Candidatus Thermoplasmatota archaeon]
MPLSDAIRTSKNGIVLSLKVTPNAKKPIFPAGYDEWRKAVEIRVKALPEKGEANAEVVELVAQFFGVPESAVSIIGGAKSREKSVEIIGIEKEKALQLLAPKL